MDDDKGLDLSLGLPCGGSSSNSKDRSGNSADTRPDTDERTSKIVNDFKNFLNAGIPQSFQRIEPVKSQENFFTSLPQTASGGNTSGSGQLLGDNKRKSVFHEMNTQKKQEREPRSPDLPDKGKTSYISITTDEGSTADNEDLAESETEGSSSRTVSHSHCEERSRTPVGNISAPQVPKEIHPKANIGAPPFPVQQMNALNVPYSITIKDSPTIGPSSTSNYSRVSMMQSIPCTSGERPGFHSTSPGNLPMTFGYSPIRVPTIDKDSPWKMVARPQTLHSPYGGRPISTSVPMKVNNPGSSEPPRLDMRPLDQSKGQTKPLAGKEGSSSHPENNAKRQEATASPSEYPSIRPGIAAEVQFGGSGSFPSLPWVSTTGPNGKTISGVTYKFNATQVKIVCACHGTHMTPDEFVRHASEERQPNTPSLASLPNGNPATSAKS